MSPTFQVGDKVSCYCDEYHSHKDAQILSFREDQTQAYIHYEHEDKRLDRWVPISELTPFVTHVHASPEVDRVLSRRDRERLQDGSEDEEQLSPEIQQFETLHREVTKIRNIDQITISCYTIRAWYYSPYPKPFHDTPHLFICDHCFRYFATQEELDEHLIETDELRPPGREIYRKDNISIFELHGRRQKLSCQCL
jgi:histone acetyltransferase MYST1